jgi:hypothetical protein
MSISSTPVAVRQSSRRSGLNGCAEPIARSLRRARICAFVVASGSNTTFEKVSFQNVWGAVGHCASNVPGTIGQCDHNVSRAVGYCLGLALVIRSIIAGWKKSLMGDGKAGEEHKGIRKHKLVLVLVLVTEYGKGR